MRADPRPPRRDMVRTLGATRAPILSAAAGLALLRVLPQGVLAHLPGCPVYRLTGLRCPGCGATRALLALLHGDVAAAWHSNQLFLLLLPLVAGYLVWGQFGRAVPPRLSRALTVALLVVTISFGVTRNL